MTTITHRHNAPVTRLFGKHSRYYQTKLTLKQDCGTTIRSVATQFSKSADYEFLMAILAGSEIDVKIYCKTHVVGFTSRDQINAQAKKALRGECGDWFSYMGQTTFDRILAKCLISYGIEQIGFSVESLVTSTTTDIQSIIDNFTSNQN